MGGKNTRLCQKGRSRYVIQLTYIVYEPVTTHTMRVYISPGEARHYKYMLQ